MEAERKELNQSRYLNYERIRIQKAMTDVQVAKKAGVALSVISDWKAGRTTPAFGNIIRIASALDVSANEFEVILDAN